MKPSSKTKQPDEQKFKEASEDCDYEKELEFLRISTRQLVHRQVLPGDGSLVLKAKTVLATGVRHIIDGKPSPDFVNFAAYCIYATLKGDEPSLDSAFRLKNKKHRPKKDPLEDPAISAFIDYTVEYDKRIAALQEEKIPQAESELVDFLKNMSGTSEEEQLDKLDKILNFLGTELTDLSQNRDRAKRNAIHAAYVARWGENSSDEKFKIDDDHIKSRKRSITDELKMLGVIEKVSKN